MALEGILKRLARKRALREENNAGQARGRKRNRKKMTARKSVSSSVAARTHRSVIQIDSSSSEEDDDDKDNTDKVMMTAKVSKENTVNAASIVQETSQSPAKTTTLPQQERLSPPVTPVTSSLSSSPHLRKTPPLHGSLKQKMKIRSPSGRISKKTTTNKNYSPSKFKTPPSTTKSATRSSTPRKLTQQKLPSSIDRSSTRKRAPPTSPVLSSNIEKKKSPRRRISNAPPSPLTTTQTHKNIIDDSDDRCRSNNVEIIVLDVDDDDDESPSPSSPQLPLPASQQINPCVKESTILSEPLDKKIASPDNAIIKDPSSPSSSSTTADPEIDHLLAAVTWASKSPDHDAACEPNGQPSETTGDNNHKVMMPCNADIDGVNDNCQDALPPNSLQAKCWACHVDLKSGNGESSIGTESSPPWEHEEPCLYAMHAHPILQVPTCSICTDATYAVETDVVRNTKTKAEGEKHLEGKPKDNRAGHERMEKEERSDSCVYERHCCSGCAKGINGSEDSVQENVSLFMCDTCPRGFCRKCVGQAHGGRSNGNLVIDQMTSSSNVKKTWICIHCDAPQPLRNLQKHLQGIVSPENKSNNEASSLAGKADRDKKSQQLLEELELLENELEACEDVDDVFLAERRVEITAELLEEGCMSQKEVQHRVEQQIASLEKEWKDHHLRVMDHVASVQDELESYGLDLLSFYENRQSRNNDTQEPSDEEEPDWKRKADEELDKRDAKAGRRKCAIPGGERVSENYVYGLDLEDLGSQDEIDDIQTEDSCLATMTEKTENERQWRNTDFESEDPPEIKRKKFQRALKMESMVLKENSIGLHRMTDNEDEVEVQDLQRSIGGRVRQDGLYMVRSKAYEEQQKGIEKLKLKGNKAPSRTDAAMTKTRKEQKTKKRITPCLVSAEVPSSSLVLGNRKFDSDLILTSPEMVRASSEDEAVNESLYRTVTVAPDLVAKLKEHQISGIKFMWTNACSDLCIKSEKSNLDSKETEKMNTGGCILAHNMGLGKTLQVIALLDTLLNHPALEYDIQDNRNSSSAGLRRRHIHTVLIVVPANTISNWEQEFEKWVEGKIQVYNMTSFSNDARWKTIGSWYRKGGVLLMTSALFVRLVKNENVKSAFLDPGPDLIVLDEAHTMVRGSSSEIAKALRSVRTKRRIALTGTPLQNNLVEYYHMVNWVRPDMLGSEQNFEQSFNKPIMAGMTSDALPHVVKLQKEKTSELHKILAPFVNRRDNSALKKELKTMQQVVLVVRQTKLQVILNRRFKKVYKSNSFLDIYSKVAPILNHPGCLVSASQRKRTVRTKYMQPNNVEKTRSKVGDTVAETSEGVIEKAMPEKCQPSSVSTAPFDNTHESEHEKRHTCARQNSECEEQWWEPVANKKGVEFCDIKHGYKVVLLLQILAHAQAIGDKVVVFSKCLRTLDFIESILNSDWGSRLRRFVSIPSIEGLSSWQKNIDYLRIDGAVSACQRGELVTSFNDEAGLLPENREAVESSKLFLISIEAGGIGINLTGANRVVFFDCHWNPAVTTQALYRCYRYGQSKPVFAYAFIAEGSMEEKIYSRSVNKSSLAARVIDQRFPDRSFTASDLDLLKNNDEWACCDRCDKWRMLPPEKTADDLPEKWYCEFLSESDPTFANCDEPERDVIWYKKRYERQLKAKAEGNQMMDCRESIDTPAYMMADEAKDEAVRRDDILTRLLSIAPEDKKSTPLKAPSTTSRKQIKKRSFISRHHFHDVLLQDCGSDSLDGGLCKGKISEEQKSLDVTQAIATPTGRALHIQKGSDQLKNTVCLDETENEKKTATTSDAFSKTKASAGKENNKDSPASDIKLGANELVGKGNAALKEIATNAAMTATCEVMVGPALATGAKPQNKEKKPTTHVTSEQVPASSSKPEIEEEGVADKLVRDNVSPSPNITQTIIPVNPKKGKSNQNELDRQTVRKQRSDSGTCDAPIDLLSDSSDIE